MIVFADPKSGDEWEIYEDRAGKFRWRRKARNGEIVGGSTEGYERITDCMENARRNGLEQWGKE